MGVRMIAPLVAAVAIVLLAVGAIVRVVQYQGVAKPGVHLLGVDVGGKSRAQIEAVARAWSAQPVTIVSRSRTYHVPRGWLVSVSAAATAKQALAAGSLRSLVVPKRVDIRPVLRPAGNAGGILGDLARANRDPVSATVSVHGTTVTVAPARRGLELDKRRLLAQIEQNRPSVRAPFTTLTPAVTTAAADETAARARALIARPIAIDYHGARPGALTPAQIARSLVLTPSGDAVTVTIDGTRLVRLVRPLVRKWIVEPHDARFVVTGGLVHIVPSKPGRDVLAEQVAAAVERAAAGDHVALVELGARAPALTTSKAKALGIDTKLVSYTTEMGVSSSNRIHNVHLMADFIDGTLIKPGQVFSFNRIVGPRTAARGFLEGQEIIGSLVLPSIGGGVCQTATTLFNDAFDAGLPILERVNHNLYLAHYPLGRDATVAWGGPDFEFRNDLKHGILIKTSYTDQTLTFTFYGTPEGRRVVSHTGPQVKWTHPSMNYAVDPSAPRNSVRVAAGTGELGFDVTVTREVYAKSGKLLRHDVFKSHYIPDSPTTVYGPGKTPPGPYIVLPASV